MKRQKNETGLDLKSESLGFLQHFGKSGPYIYGIARGIDERQVRPDRIRKSIGAEDAFVEDVDNFDLAKAELRPLAEKVRRYCEAHDITGKTVTVKIKYSDFSQATRSQTVSGAVSDVDQMLEIAEFLLASVFPFKRPVRLLGITLSSLNTEENGQEPQLALGLWSALRKTKKPAAGGGAAGFSKRTEQRLGGGVPLFRQTPLGRRSGPPEIEALREEVHRFDENQDTHSRRTLNRLCCSAVMRKVHGLNLRGEISSSAPRGGPDTETPASSAGELSIRLAWKQSLSERPMRGQRCECRRDRCRGPAAHASSCGRVR
jgi:DNA polymerase-4